MATILADQIDRERKHAGTTRSDIPEVEFPLEQYA